MTIRTSSNPRVRATSARLRASPECPQMTGSARTTITSRFVGLWGGGLDSGTGTPGPVCAMWSDNMVMVMAPSW